MVLFRPKIFAVSVAWLLFHILLLRHIYDVHDQRKALLDLNIEDAIIFK